MKSIVDHCRESADRFPNSIAVIEGEERWTHGQLYDRVDRLSQALAKLGVRKGDVVAAWLPNVHEAIECELACLQSGGLWVTLHGELTWAEVCGVIGATEPRILIVGPGQFEKFDLDAPFAPSAVRDMPVIVTGPETISPSGSLFYEELIETHEPVRPDVSLCETDIARLRYTSGTTGAAKAAMLTHDVYLASLEVQRAQLHPLDETDRVLHAAPLTHASGALVFPILAAGGANVVMSRFDAEAALATIERERISTMFCVPTILHRLSESPGFNTRDLSSLKTVTYGGAPAAVDKLEPIMKRLPGVLVQIFGLTEALHPVSTLLREEHYAGNPKLGSVGKPTHICEVRIVDGEGLELPQGEVGEIAIRGRNVMAGYWRDEAATMAVFRDGWLLSGDLAYRDEDGYIFIVDRKKDVIITGGFNVYTSEVERVLSDRDDIAEAAVFGIPHDEWGEAVHAVVVPAMNHAPSEEALRHHCEKFLSKYKIPKTIAVRSEPLPKSGAGKIVKADLRRAYWEGYERQIH